MLAVSGVVLGAWYMLWLVKRVFFGPLRERKDGHPIHDLTLREIAALVPLCVVIVWIGVQPKYFLDRMAPSTDQLTAPAMTAVESAQPTAAPEESQSPDEVMRQEENSHGDIKTSVGEEAPSAQRVEKLTQRRKAERKKSCIRRLLMILVKSLSRIPQVISPSRVQSSSTVRAFAPSRLCVRPSSACTHKISSLWRLLVSLEVVGFLSAEIVLVAAALLIYMGGAFSTSQKAWAPIAFIALALAAASLWSCGGNEQYAQNVANRLLAAESGGSVTLAKIAAHIDVITRNSPVIADPLSAFGRWFALAVGAVMVLMAWRPLATGATPEYIGSLLLIVAGLMLVAVASNLVMIFVGLELISIPTYIMLSLGRRDPAAQESAAKYFYLSILSSGVLLYGLSFVYGATGSMSLPSIGAKLAHGAHLPEGVESFAKLGMVLVLAGLCFRVTAVPFHFYAPDVYQGTIHANAALLSVLPKAAGLLAIVRVIVLAMPDLEIYGWKIVLAISILTMTVGNVLALWQDNVAAAVGLFVDRQRRLYAHRHRRGTRAEAGDAQPKRYCGMERRGRDVLLSLRLRRRDAGRLRRVCLSWPRAAAA